MDGTTVRAEEENGDGMKKGSGSVAKLAERKENWCKEVKRKGKENKSQRVSDGSEDKRENEEIRV